jgi:RHS repeat-associated protein
LSALPLKVSAQIAIPPTPPVFVELDRNGVDLSTGQLRITGSAVSVGAGEGSLQWAFLGLGMRDSLSGTALPEYSEDPYHGINVVTISIGGRSSTFTNSNELGDDLHPAKGAEKQSILFRISADGYTEYVFRAEDSSTAILTSKYITNIDGRVYYQISSLTRPNGEVISYSYENCGAGCNRVNSVSSNLGYVIKYQYNSSTSNLQSVKAINAAVDYCDPASLNCTASGNWMSATMTGSPKGTGTFTITDALSRTTTYTLVDGRITNIASPGGQTTQVTYDGQGRVSYVTTAAGQWHYVYANTGPYNSQVGAYDVVTTVTDPLGNSRSVVTSASLGRVTSATDETGRTTTYTLDAVYGRINRITYPEGDAVDYVYDARGNVTQETRVPKAGSGLSSVSTTANYDTSCANPLTCNSANYVIDSRGNRTDYTYDSQTGLLLTKTLPARPNGVRPELRYKYTPLYAKYKNASGGLSAYGAPVQRLTEISSCANGAAPSCIGAADEVRTTVGYSGATGVNNLLPTTMTTATGDGLISAVTTQTYDAIGNIATIDGPVAGVGDTTRYVYDAARQLVASIGPDPDGGGSRKPAVTKLTYNLDGQPAEVGQGYADDQSDLALSQAIIVGRVVTAYDTAGRVSSVDQVAGGAIFAMSQYNYDALDRSNCVAVRMNASTFSNKSVDACQLGTEGAEGKDRITRTTYDGAGRVLSVTSGFASDSPMITRRVTYTLNGQVETEKDGEGNVTSYAYDGLDRLRRVIYPNTTKGAGASNSGDYEEYVYDAAGNVTSRTLRGGGTITSTYDNLDRVRTRTTPLADVAGANYVFGYDNFGQPVSVTDGARTTSRNYDALGRLLWEQDDTLGLASRVSYEYDAAGRRTKLTWPDNFFVAYDYDAVGNLTTVRRAGSSSAADTIASFAYDNLGRRTNVTRGDNKVATSYAYSASNLLLSSLTQAPSSAADTVTYGLSYNVAGQVKGRATSNAAYTWTGAYAVGRPYATDGLNRIVTAGMSGQSGYTVYGHDNRGNLVCAAAAAPACTAPTVRYLYDAENRLRGTTAGASLTYDPLSRLFSSTTVGGTVTRYLYDGANVIGEYNTSNTLLRRYVFGDGSDEVLVRYSGASTTPEWLLTDQQGSIVAATDSNGAVTSKLTYDEYGTPGSGNVSLFQYTGQLYLSDLSLYHYKARSYSPTLGRFLQTDPIGYADGLNWYAYVDNDPLNKIDPTGTNDLSSVIIWGRKDEDLAQAIARQQVVDGINLLRSQADNVVESLTVLARKAMPAKTCPKGRVADFARSAREFGSSLQAAGDWTAVAGVGVAGLGAVALQPEIVAAGGVGAIVGKGVSVTGLGIQLLAGAYLYRAGDARPLTSTAAGEAVGGFFPPALPGYDPAGDVGDAVTRRIYRNLPEC